MDRCDLQPTQAHPRRQFLQGILASAGAAVLAQGGVAHAWSVADLTSADATLGVKTALERGASMAVDLLGRPDGFLGNDKVRIPLPGMLEDAGRLMRTFGQGRRVDELSTAMNRAAELAVPMGRDVLLQAVRSMTVTDAKKILTGGDTSVTEFFAVRTREPLTSRFTPLIKDAMHRVSMAQTYNDFASRASRYGLVKAEDAHLEQYVTGKTLDALYLVIAEEERKIRQDPVGTGSQILQKVFGALR